mgnify:CR=1 FL=1
MNFRNSKQRDAILSVLSKKNYHPTVDDIYAIVKKDFPKISIATVYRNVEQLCRMNKIWRINEGSSHARYDGNIERHYHISCPECGSVDDVWLPERLENLIEIEKVIPEYSEINYNIEFKGICKKCSSKK